MLWLWDYELLDSLTCHLHMVSHVVLTSCGAFREQNERKPVFFNVGIRQRSLPWVASIMLLRTWDVLAASPTGSGESWLKPTRKAPYSRGWEKQSKCQCGHKIAAAKAKDATHSLTALFVFLPSRWAEGGWWPPCCFGVTDDMLNFLWLHLFQFVRNKLFTSHYLFLVQSIIHVCLDSKGQQWQYSACFLL